MTPLPWTPSLQHALEAIRRAEASSVRGRDSSAALDLAKLAFADAVLAGLQADRLTRLPSHARPVDVREAPLRRRRRA